MSANGVRIRFSARGDCYSTQMRLRASDSAASRCLTSAVTNGWCRNTPSGPPSPVVPSLRNLLRDRHATDRSRYSPREDSAPGCGTQEPRGFEPLNDGFRLISSTKGFHRRQRSSPFCQQHFLPSPDRLHEPGELPVGFAQANLHRSPFNR